LNYSADITNHCNQGLILVTGPARSGKSEWAEAIALNSGAAVIYIATAQTDPADPEWQARIDQHRQRRPNHWKTLDVPVHLADSIEQASATSCLLVDSLGTWLANHLQAEAAEWQQTRDRLLHSLQQAQGQVILVAEETGWGVVPAYPVGRTFRDRLGDLVRRIGAIADAVYLVTGGHALNLTQLGTPLAPARTLNQSDQNL
jgi:adenosylcobinamide kinase / adenosylcobinamide-phosphate guanylyltransferase